jgi:hypothetical protein
MNPKMAVATIATVAALLAPAGASAFDQSFIPYHAGNPATNGCPSGWEALQLADLAKYPYRVPIALDSRANGGNGDGVVCGKPVSSAEEDARFSHDTNVPIIFNFRDNTLNASTG